MEKDFPFYPSIPGTTELSGRQFYAVEASGQMRRFSCTGKTLLWTAPEQEPLALSGQTLKIGDSAYRITAVGSEAPVTLAGLGHCTVNFSGQSTVELPGTIYVENKPMPEIAVGTAIQIIED